MATTLWPDSSPVSAGELLDRVRSARVASDAEEVTILRLALEWAHRHVVAPAEPEPRPVCHLEAGPSGESDHEALAAHERLGLPEIAWHAGASLAVALRMSTAAGDKLIRDALILSMRLPRLWERVLACEVAVWRARRVADAAAGAPADVATYLDQHIAPVAEKIGPAGLDKLIDAAMLAMYPEEREIAQLEALDARHATLDETSINHTGIAEMTVRGEWADPSAFDATLSAVAALLGGDGAPDQHESFGVRRSIAVGVLADPARAAALLDQAADDPDTAPRRTRVFPLVAQLTEANLHHLDHTVSDDQQRAWLCEVVRQWTGRPDLRVHVQPIRHCGGCADCDHAEDTEQRTRTRCQPTRSDTASVWARDPVCIFPWCHRPARRCDLDHRIPYDHHHPDRGGPTSPDNLAPLCRRHHRLKTHAAWTYTTVEPGTHLKRDRYGQTLLRTRDGTTDLTGPPDR